MKMTKISEIYDYIDSLAPFRTQDSWDNAGLLTGSMGGSVTKALVALDAKMPVIEEAKKLGCELIVTHHPVIFNPLRCINEDVEAGRLVKYSISCICAHTNLDSAEYGISDMMADALGMKNLHIPLEINRTDPETGRRLGYGTTAECESMSPERLAALCKERFGCVGIRYVPGRKNIRKVGMVSGAGGEFISAAEALGLDALITAEVKHHQFIEAERTGITLIDAGHFETEVIAAEYLWEKLSSRFDGTEFILSEVGSAVRTI